MPGPPLPSVVTMDSVVFVGPPHDRRGRMERLLNILTDDLVDGSHGDHGVLLFSVVVLPPPETPPSEFEESRVRRYFVFCRSLRELNIWLTRVHESFRPMQVRTEIAPIRLSEVITLVGRFEDPMRDEATS